MKYTIPLLALFVSILAIGCIGKKNDPKPTVVTPICECSTTPLSLMADEVFITYPTAYTPNGDGRNDVFRPVFGSDTTLSSYNLTISSGKNEIVFTTDQINKSWYPEFYTPYLSEKYYYRLKWTTKSGKSIDTCGCIQLIQYDALSGCLDTSAKVYYFEDQFDPNTGQHGYQSGEDFCN